MAFANLNPLELQEKWTSLWDANRVFQADPNRPGKPFSVVIPPPNVTGALHLGHGINNTLQDILTRYHRMKGDNTLWVPGTDHAGIATQAVVEKLTLQRENKTRHDLGREELVKRIWSWKDQYERRILNQLKLIGSSCDWSRTRFTLDDMCSAAVRQTFFSWFQSGLIFRGKRLVNWDAHLQTAVADDEVENRKQKGTFWYFYYPVAGGPIDGIDKVLIGTTRPETMLGDTAVAVHPDPAGELDKRIEEIQAELIKANEKDQAELRDRLEKIEIRKRDWLPTLLKLTKLAQQGVKLELPMVGRLIPLITDAHADPEKGTGAVKVTPAHDHNDYAVWQRNPHNAVPINILEANGAINQNGKGTYRGTDYSYVGIDRAVAREKVIADITELGLFDRAEEVENTIPLSDRSKTPIEPYLSDQWFVRMSDARDGSPGLAQLAIDAVEQGRVKFTPDRYAKTYTQWLAEKRDWCISRQLWWGHRIPVWSKSGSPKEIESFVRSLGFFDTTMSPIADNLLSLTPRKDLAGIMAGTLSHDPDTGSAFVAICVAPGNEEWERKLESLGLARDPDVLDTWFSSALWPHSTLGWPSQTADLARYYPTSVLVTSRDIITLWVARMVLAGLSNCQQIPFHHVIIHPKILDGFGETMSKSKGNGVDPLDIVSIYGADALRFGLAMMATETQDARLPVANVCPHCQTLVPVKNEHMYMRTKKLNCPSCKQPFRPGGPWPDEDAELKTAKQSSERFEIGRNFGTKLMNASKLIIGSTTGDIKVSPDAIAREIASRTSGAATLGQLPLEDRWILSRLNQLIASVNQSLERYQFSELARQIYDFVWSEFCDWYLEVIKPRLRAGEVACLATSYLVLDRVVRLLHPIMPFLTEEIWTELRSALPAEFQTQSFATEAGPFLCLASWPGSEAAWNNPEAESQFGLLQEITREVRRVKAEFGLEVRTEVDAVIITQAGNAAVLRANEAILKNFAKLKSLAVGPELSVPAKSVAIIQPAYQLCIPLEGFVDLAAERDRQTKKLRDVEQRLKGVESKLASPAFVDKAPAEVVEQQRQLAADLKTQIASAQKLIAMLASN